MSKFGKGKDSFSEVSFENKQRQIEERLYAIETYKKNSIVNPLHVNPSKFQAYKQHKGWTEDQPPFKLSEIN